MTKATKILFLVTEDWYFFSHRLPIARAARDAGCEVIVATRVQSCGDMITREGFKLVPLRLKRRNRNPLREITSILEIMRIYRQERPDLVHQVAMKPVVYGSLAAALTSVPVTVNAMAGLGFVFTSDRWLASLLKPLVQAAFRKLLGRPNDRVIVQNPEDRKVLMESMSLPDSQLTVIRGSGVDVQRFMPAPEPTGMIIITLVARMLWDKGVGEFVEATRILKQQGLRFRAVLVGDPDPENPASIPEGQLHSWVSGGWVEWWGLQDDMPSVWARSHIAVLPSYREGLPKSLLEAAACARPIVASDVPGCREIVHHNENGFLVEPKNASTLAEAMKKLVNDQKLRTRMGAQGREMVEQHFSDAIVVAETLRLYKEALGGKWPESKHQVP